MSDIAASNQAATDEAGQTVKTAEMALQSPPKVSVLFQFLYFLSTFSGNFILLPVGILLIPWQTELLDPAHATVNQGLAQALGGVASVIAAPLVGALSDRTTFRLGRRRSWLLIGILLAAAALVWLANSVALWMIFLGWFVLQFMADAIRGALQAIIPDRVPTSQRGRLSSYIGLALSLASVIGSLFIAVVFKNNKILSYYLFLSSLAIIPIFLLVYKEKPLEKDVLPPFHLRAFLRRFWVSPRKSPDFAWAFASRTLFFMAYFMVVLFLRLYVEKGLHYAELNPGRTVDQAVTILQSTLLLPLIISSVVAGIISDRLQKQKIVVLIAGLLSAFAFLLPALLGSWVMTLAWAVLFGIGYGAFFAVDTALAVQVLPNAADRGKDLGIIALAMAIPQIIAPLTSSAILSATGNNFSLLFFCACACAALAGLLVLRIKNAR